MCPTSKNYHEDQASTPNQTTSGGNTPSLVMPEVIWCYDDHGQVFKYCDPDEAFAKVAEMESQRDSALSRLAQVEEERDRLQKRFDHHRDWNQQRYDAVRKWVDEEVKPLSGDVATRYFSIVANGSPSPYEQADWTNTLHAREIRIHTLQSQLDEARKLIAGWEEVGRKQRELSETIKERELKASMIACSNAWMACADDLKKIMEKTK